MNNYIEIYNLLTAKEILTIKKNINKSCMNCTNTDCKVPYKEKIGLDEDGNEMGYNCIGWNNKELIVRNKSPKKKLNE